MIMIQPDHCIEALFLKVFDLCRILGKLSFISWNPVTIHVNRKPNVAESR